MARLVAPALAPVVVSNVYSVVPAPPRRAIMEVLAAARKAVAPVMFTMVVWE